LELRYHWTLEVVVVVAGFVCGNFVQERSVSACGRSDERRGWNLTLTLEATLPEVALVVQRNSPN
jgi:hypothetical protein